MVGKKILDIDFLGRIGEIAHVSGRGERSVIRRGSSVDVTYKRNSAMLAGIVLSNPRKLFEIDVGVLALQRILCPSKKTRTGHGPALACPLVLAFVGRPKHVAMSRPR